MRAIHQFNNGRGHHIPEPPTEKQRKIGSTMRNKIFAVNSFRNGREITEYVEVSDSELESSDIEPSTDDEVEKIKTEIDDLNETKEPKDDGGINTTNTHEIKEDNNDKKSKGSLIEATVINNSAPSEVNSKVFNFASN